MSIDAMVVCTTCIKVGSSKPYLKATSSLNHIGDFCFDCCTNYA